MSARAVKVCKDQEKGALPRHDAAAVAKKTETEGGLRGIQKQLEVLVSATRLKAAPAPVAAHTVFITIHTAKHTEVICSQSKQIQRRSGSRKATRLFQSHLYSNDLDQQGNKGYFPVFNITT